MESEIIDDTLYWIRQATVDPNILALLDAGWYVPQNIRLRTVFDLARLVNQGQPEAAESIIMLFFKKNLPALGKFFSERHPNPDLICQGIAAHQKGLYTAAVLSFLAATHALCLSQNSRIKQIATGGNMRSNREINGLLGTSWLPQGYFSKRNRQSVMQGEAPAAGEKESFMSMALLGFFADFIEAFESPAVAQRY